MTVAKLRAARERKRERTGKCEGRKSYSELSPDMVRLAKELHNAEGRKSLRSISAELAARGFMTAKGTPYPAASIKRMIGA